MTRRPHDEEEQLRSVALQNAKSILAARQRAEQELIQAKEALELRTTELAYSLSTMRATLESTTDGILVTEDDGRVVDFNDTYVKMWRIPGDVMDARHHRRILEFVSEQVRDPAQFISRIDEIYSQAPPESFDVLELTDGRIFERLSKPRFIGEKRVGRVWSFRDVTERRQARREHAYLAAIVASSTDGIISKGLDGIITSWNAAAVRIFGYEANEAVGKPIKLIIPAELAGEEETLLARLRRGERVEQFETVRVRKDGRRINVSLTISPVLDGSGQIIGASKIVRDTTEREQLLAREREARGRAEEASRLKDEFLATVSHEVRTPLNAILGWAKLLQMGTMDEAKSRHAALVIERNARAQAQVIEDLLDVSRIIAGKLRLDIQTLMPSAAIESALESVRPMAEAKGVELHAALDAQAGPISGDSSRLQQIVWNLLSNAIKFTPGGGRVDVRLERINSHLEIAVSDTGEGLSPEFLPHAFDRFRQADASASRTSGGLGLGLAIVRQLVELHGGVVTAESAGIGCGATFTVRLPLRAVHRQRQESERTRPKPAGGTTSGPLPSLVGVRVLVVDDENDARDLLREALEQCGAEVRDARSVKQALDHVQQWRPNVIVSDIGMPEEDGYALIHQVREWEKEVGTWIPAVALTAYARGEDRVRALRSGYQVHVSKPIEPMEFVLLVAGLLRAK